MAMGGRRRVMRRGISCHFQDRKGASGHECDWRKQRYSKYQFASLSELTAV